MQKKRFPSYICSLLLTSRAAGVAPSRDQTAGARAGAAGGQGHGADVAVQGGGLAQLDQHDVIVQVAAAVSGVADDLSGVDELLCALIDSNVVLTKTHLDAATERWKWIQCIVSNGNCEVILLRLQGLSVNCLHLRLVAVSSRHHPGAGDQGASTEVVAAVQRDLVGHRVLSALIASNNLVILIIDGSGI